MKRILIITLLQLCVWGIYAQTSVVKLKGEIKGLNGAEVVLLNADQTELERVQGQGDKFSMQANVVKGDGRVYYLYVPSLGKLGPSMTIPYFFFFIDTNSLDIRAEIQEQNLKRLSIQHSPTLEAYDALYAKNPYQKQITEVGAQYNEAFHAYNNVAQTAENRKKLQLFSDSLETLYKKLTQSFLDRVPSNQHSDALFLILHSSIPLQSESAIEDFLRKFDAKLVRTNYYAKELQEKSALIKASGIGAIAPDFELKDQFGKSVKLSSLRGQYVLVDFWASWCGPCRKEIPNVKRIYENYKDKGLQVVGVSIDKDEGKWRQAIEEEKVSYLQWWDPEMKTGKLYNYNGIPFIVLISPDGRILGRQLRGEALYRKVSECLDSKPFEIAVTLAKPYKGKVFLTYIKDRFTKLDSLQVEGTSFSFKGVISQTDQYRLTARPRGIDVSICVEPGAKYQVDVDANGRMKIETPDGKEQKLMNEFKELTAPFEAKTTALSMRYSKLKELQKDAEAEALQQQISASFEKGQDARKAFIRKYPKSFAAMVVASDLLTNQYTDLREVYELVDTVRYDYSYSWRSFKGKYQEAAAKWIQNKQAPDFITKDLKGNVVRLADFKGKYLLLDFWASWCRPCRAKMKELKAVYPELQQKGIIVCSISLDDKQEQWEKATREDGIVWVNTCDLKSFKENVIAADYKVTGVPTLFVVDPDGVIVSQNPSIKEILDLKVK